MNNISVQSEEFIAPVDEALSNGRELVVWHQIPRSGGQQEWYLINQIEGLLEILRQGQTGSAFTIDE